MLNVAGRASTTCWLKEVQRVARRPAVCSPNAHQRESEGVNDDVEPMSASGRVVRTFARASTIQLCLRRYTWPTRDPVPELAQRRKEVRRGNASFGLDRTREVS